jgi:predicted small lipoprotein YifL
MKARVLSAMLIAASLLAGCGVRGALERPPPMFGKQRAEYIAQQEREKAENAAREAAGETPAPPPPDQPIQTSPIQAPIVRPQGVAPPVATKPAP